MLQAETAKIRQTSLSGLKKVTNTTVDKYVIMPEQEFEISVLAELLHVGN